MPASPNAAALERYALMPVNEAAGTPSISIPLYEVHSGSLDLPLSISYHASGIRVTDQASWVGLGWALNAGGVITRQVRGRPDERPNGFGQHYNQVPNRNTLSVDRDETLLSEVAGSRIDYQPDLYSYNMGGQAGSFMLGNDGVFHTLPLQPVRIRLQPDTTFLLTDAHGVNYWFARRETSYSTGRPPASVHYTSSWYLSRVVSADRADTIRLEYETYTLVTPSVQQQRSLVFSIDKVSDLDIGGPSPGPQDSFSETISYTHQITCRLRRIVFRAGQITFNTATRQDVPADRQLMAVTVVTRGQDTLRQVRFYHSYFGDAPRLRLDSLATTSPGPRLPPHRFTYNPLDLPGQLFGSRDHWGYYNGATPIGSGQPSGSNLLIPDIPVVYRSAMAVYIAADREPNPAFVQAAILTDIGYPTGGKQHFTYEPNTVAEQYPTPPIALPALNLSTAGPGPSATPVGGQHDSSFDTLRVMHAGTRVHYSLIGHEYLTTNGVPDNVHDKVEVLMHSLAPSPQMMPTLQVLFSDPNAGGYGDTSGDFALAIGSYLVELRSSGNTHAEATLSPSYLEPGTPAMSWRNAVVGGVRLREERIQASRQAAATIKRYDYSNPNTSLSSGYLTSGSVPVYDRLHISRIAGKCMSHLCTIRAIVDVTYLTIGSSSLTSLTGGDRNVGYAYVAVVDSSSTGEINGRRLSRYGAVPDDGGGWKPALPTVSNAWQRDQLMEQHTYSTSSTGRKDLLTVVKNDYVMRDTVLITSFNASTDAVISYGPATIDIRKYAYENSLQPIGYQYLSRMRQYRYAVGDTTKYQLTTTTYRYDNPRHQQPTQVATSQSGGQWQLSRTRYTADFDTAQVTGSSTGPALAIRELLRGHVLAQPVEQLTLRTTGTDTVVTSGGLTLSRILAPRVVVADQQWALRLAAPLRWATFGGAALRAGQMAFNAHYEPSLYFDRYDARRQLLQVHPRGGQPVSYLWDQLAGQPMAKANAPVAQVAYTGFEPLAAGRWLFRAGGVVRGPSHSGGTAYNLQGSDEVSRDSIPVGDYELTGWIKGGSLPGLASSGGSVTAQPQFGTSTRDGWQPFRSRLHLVSPGTVRVQANPAGTTLLLDDLLLQPVGAQTATYTYDALRGMTSQTDPSGRTTTYEYDALGRLLRTRDEQGRILSQQQYHYAR